MISLIVLAALVGLAFLIVVVAFVAARRDAANRRDIEFLLKTCLALEQEWGHDKHHLATMEWVRETLDNRNLQADRVSRIYVSLEALKRKVAKLTPKKKPAAKKPARKKARK